MKTTSTAIFIIQSTLGLKSLLKNTRNLWCFEEKIEEQRFHVTSSKISPKRPPEKSAQSALSSQASKYYRKAIRQKLSRSVHLQRPRVCCRKRLRPLPTASPALNALAAASVCSAPTRRPFRLCPRLEPECDFSASLAHPDQVTFRGYRQGRAAATVTSDLLSDYWKTLPVVGKGSSKSQPEDTQAF